MAKEDGIDLGDDHWEIINFLREYYEEYQIAPAVRVLTKAVGKNLVKIKVIVNIYMSYFHMVQVNKHVNLLDYQSQLVAYNYNTKI
jgi:TusE/DsrC/DsvC family sulfur relay protein